MLLKNNDGRVYRHSEIGICVSDGLKLYREGTVVFSLKDEKDEEISLLRNGVPVGTFASGKIGLYVMEGDVLEIIHKNLSERKTVYVESVSGNIFSLQKGQTIYLYDHKITKAGKVQMNPEPR